MSHLLTTLVLLGFAVLIGWLLGRVVAISRRDDARNALIDAERARTAAADPGEQSEISEEVAA